MAGQATDKSKGVLGPGLDDLAGQIAASSAGRRAISGQLRRAERARTAAASELDVEPQLENANRARDETNGGPGSIAFRRLSSLLQPAYVFVSFTEGGGGGAAGVYATTLQDLLPQLGKGADPELRLVDLVGRLRERSGIKRSGSQWRRCQVKQTSWSLTARIAPSPSVPQTSHQCKRS